MIRYILNKEQKQIELLSGGSIEEFRDLMEKFNGYEFVIHPKKEEGGQTKIIDGNAKFIINRVEHN